ncbi:MAG: alpha/beta hydrolase [Candidatus Sulfotelmatobacter sp.]
MPNSKNNDIKERLVRHLQIKLSVIGKTSGKTISIPVWFVIAVVLTSLATFPALHGAQTHDDTSALKKIVVRDGVELHYEERGDGTPLIFVHGSLSDGSYWHDQLAPFAQAGFHVIAYSRRYNFPNKNKARPGYSAVVDADDLAALIQKLHLGKVDVVGHSYGALTALFLAVRHPELVRRLVLCEAPAVSLLGHLHGDQSALGKETLADIQARMVKPMQAAFRKGDGEEGVRVFIGYVMRNPQAWDNMSKAAHEETLKNVEEWNVMMTTGELFPNLDPKAVEKIHAPVLLLSGQKSYPFLGLIDEELARLIPDNRRIILPGATHQMWFEQPAECRKDVLEFFRGADASAARASASYPDPLFWQFIRSGTGVSDGMLEVTGAFIGGFVGSGRQADAARPGC